MIEGEIHTNFMEKAAIAVQNERVDLAEKYLELEENIKGKTQETLSLRAFIERRKGNEDKAFRYIEEAASIGNDEVKAFYVNQLIEKGLFEKAKSVIESIQDEQTSFLLSAELDTCIGYADRAEETYKKVIERWPDCQAAYIKLIRISKISRDDISTIDPEKIEQLADNPSTPKDNAIGLYNVLGKLYEDIEDYEKSSHFYRKACDLKRGDFPKDVMSYYRQQLTRVKEFYTKEIMDNVPTEGIDDSKLLFVFGMPRSGTTLTEQCLVSHSG
ncbi:MAG: hypothetical protein D6732_05435, partial [Methanobacteriota archaeon]